MKIILLEVNGYCTEVCKLRPAILTIGIASNANTATPKKRGNMDHPANFGNRLGLPVFGIK
jgi:hypothetical protein